MESEHHLSLYTAETEDGISRPAGMQPRRKNVAFFLHEAGRNDFTSACNVSGYCNHMVGDAPRHRKSGSRDSPTGICTDGMEQAECVAAAARPELKMSANGRTAIMPSAVASPHRWRSVRNSLVPSRAQACDAPRHGGTTSPLTGIGCAAVLLGPRLCSASAAGRNARPSHSPRHIRCDPHSCSHSLCSRESW
ncbi:hypothetical protein TcBrA4_0001990 [Trypanosoma cruzi]|nr:hypothetical protein TcBrA4_0001990 [Trypanosoma cruzi]